MSRETEDPRSKVQLGTQPGIYPGVPTSQRRAEQSKAESEALGEGREEHGKDFPALTLQHLPPLLTPPAPPGCESKTNPCP